MQHSRTMFAFPLPIFQASAKKAIKDFGDKLQERISEMNTDNVKSAHLAHPLNMAHMVAEENPKGYYHTLSQQCKPAFFSKGRYHPDWNKGLCNDVVDWLAQRGMWSDGRLLSQYFGKTVTAFWEDVGIEKGKPWLSEFMLRQLAYVIDSGESERAWAIFQQVDPKG